MGTNFNVGSFNAINTSEVEDKKPSNNFHGTGDDLKKKLLIFGGIIIVGVILIAVILVLFSKHSPPRYCGITPIVGSLSAVVRVLSKSVITE